MQGDGPHISTFVIAVTGGIGSGKTTVCRRFEERYGVPVIDTDIVAREVVEPGEAGLEALVDAFGPEILNADGTLDRRRLKGIVFADDARRKTLEAILHPRIRQRMVEHLAAVRAPYCLLCIPLLAEGGGNGVFDRVLAVDCPEALQIARVTARDDLTEQEVIAIMRTQASREARAAIADDIITNDGDNDALERAIEALHQAYSRMAAQHHAQGS